MQMVAKVVTEAFLMVLSVLAAPQSLNDFRIDAIGRDGYMGTMIVKRTDDGFTLYSEENKELVQFMTVKVSKDDPNEFNIVAFGDKKETVNFNKSIQQFSLDKLRKENQLTMDIIDGSKIKMNRSGSIVYLTYSQTNRTSVVQCYEQPKKQSRDSR